MCDEKKAMGLTQERVSFVLRMFLAELKIETYISRFKNNNNINNNNNTCPNRRGDTNTTRPSPDFSTTRLVTQKEKTKQVRF